MGVATVRATEPGAQHRRGQGGAGSLPGLSEAVTLQSGDGFEILPNPQTAASGPRTQTKGSESPQHRDRRGESGEERSRRGIPLSSPRLGSLST